MNTSDIEIEISSINFDDATRDELVQERDIRESHIDAMEERLDCITVLMQTLQCEMDTLKWSLNREQVEYERIGMELAERSSESADDSDSEHVRRHEKDEEQGIQV